MTQLPFRRLSALTLTAALAALILAACGSSSSTSSTSSAAAAASSGSGTPAGGAASGSSSNRATLAACLKAHGVTLPARPATRTRRPPAASGNHPGYFFGGGGGGAGRRFANNPKLRAAFQACGGGRGFSAGRRALSHAAVTRFVACVKQHGYSLPAPNFSGKGPIFPASIAKNTAFQKAARTCQADLRPAGAPSPGGPPGGGPGTTSGA